MERHVPVDDPADKDEERSDEESNLDAGANGNAHGQVHLVSKSDDDGGPVFGGAARDGNKDETNECLADASTLHQIINAPDEVFGAEGDKDGGDSEDDGSGAGVQRRLPDLGLFALWLGFCIEKVAVSAQLESKVDRVE